MGIFKKRPRRYRAYADIPQEVHLELGLLAAYKGKHIYDIATEALKIGMKQLLKEYNEERKKEKKNILVMP